MKTRALKRDSGIAMCLASLNSMALTTKYRMTLTSQQNLYRQREVREANLTSLILYSQIPSLMLVSGKQDNRIQRICQANET